MTNIQCKEWIDPGTLEVADGVFDVVVKRADGSSVSLLDDMVGWGSGGCSPVEALESIVPNTVNPCFHEISLGGGFKIGEMIQKLTVVHIVFRKVIENQPPARFHGSHHGSVNTRKIPSDRSYKSCYSLAVLFFRFEKKPGSTVIS